MKTISTPQLSVQVSEHGAELCSIVANGKERHSPVLFPIVGSVWENKYRHEGITYPLTQPSFARDREGGTLYWRAQRQGLDATPRPERNIR